MLESLKIIDCHVHLGYALTRDEILDSMQKYGIEKAVVFAFPTEAAHDSRVNDLVLTQSRVAKVFIPFFYVMDDLKLPLSFEEFRGVKWHWVRGVAHMQSNLSVLIDPSFKSFVDKVLEADVPVILEEDFEFTVNFVAKAEGVKVIIPHMGLLGGSPKMFIDRFKNVEDVYFDTSLASSDVILEGIKALGANRIVFGSDMPFGEQGRELDKILKLDIADDDKRKILYDNLAKLLRVTS